MSVRCRVRRSGLVLLQHGLDRRGGCSILSPTMSRPPSSGMLKSTPKSLREMLVVPSKPTRVPPHGSPLGCRGTRRRASIGPGDALERQVAGDQQALAAASNAVVANVIGPLFSTSKKSPERRWRVAVLLAGVDRVQVDGGGRRLGRLAGDDLALELLELAADLAHQVAGGEADLGVAGVDGPGAGRDGGAAGRRCSCVLLRS